MRLKVLTIVALIFFCGHVTAQDADYQRILTAFEQTKGKVISYSTDSALYLALAPSRTIDGKPAELRVAIVLLNDSPQSTSVFTVYTDIGVDGAVDYINRGEVWTLSNKSDQYQFDLIINILARSFHLI